MMIWLMVPHSFYFRRTGMILTAEAMGPPQILDDPFDDPEGHGSIVTWSKDMEVRPWVYLNFGGRNS